MQEFKRVLKYLGVVAYLLARIVLIALALAFGLWDRWLATVGFLIFEAMLFSIEDRVRSWANKI